MHVVDKIRKFRQQTIKYKYPSFFQPDWITLILPNAIGDRVFVLSYLRAFRENNKGKKIRIVSEENKIDMINLFKEEIDELTICSKKDMKLLLKGDTIYGAYSDRIIICNMPIYFTNSYDRIMKYPHFNMFTFIKSCVLGLDESAEPTTPKVTFESESIYRKPFVLVCTEATSVKQLNKEIWDRLQNRLEENGFAVYYNTPGKENLSEYEINADLCNLLNIASNAEMVIGLRSGILDWLSLSGTSVIAIYPSQNAMDFFNMDVMPGASERYQLVLSNHTIDKIMEIINARQ